MEIRTMYMTAYTNPQKLATKKNRTAHGKSNNVHGSIDKSADMLKIKTKHATKILRAKQNMQDKKTNAKKKN